MQSHINFFSITAKDNFELGFSMGEKFGTLTRHVIAEQVAESGWAAQKERAKQYLGVTQTHFPQYLMELRGYAEGAQVDFLSLWTLSLEDEVREEHTDRCTTIVTNGGQLISHNEDWEYDSEDNIWLLLKKVGETAILELYYTHTLGGNAVSINSHGFMTTVNTLSHGHKKLGVPRNIVARWVSETKSPDVDFLKLTRLPRSLGFNFNIFSREGEIWSVEYNSDGATLVRPNSPYVHTNHYLTELKSYETNSNARGSFDRYEVACAKVQPRMTVSALTELTGDRSRGDVVSIMNERTIGKMVVDLEHAVAWVWMRREKASGWLSYPLGKFLGW